LAAQATIGRPLLPIAMLGAIGVPATPGSRSAGVHDEPVHLLAKIAASLLNSSSPTQTTQRPFSPAAAAGW